MAELRPYDPSKPWISVNLPTKEEIIAATLGLIPGYRALKNMYDNPEGPFTETLDLAAEDIIPLYGSLIKPAIKGEDIDTEQALKEAAILGIPMPYVKYPKGHPKAGEAIPNNLKEGLGTGGWSTVKQSWKPDSKRPRRKLYADPDDMRFRGSTEGRLSSVARVNTTADARNAIDVPAGPYRETNTGSNLINQGRRAMNTNTIATENRRGNLKGTLAWQGDMYPPGRSLARLDEAGPYVWDAVPNQREYIRKLNDIINENENKWEYLINKTRSKDSKGRNLNPSAIVPKEDIISIALEQGRPDIAARVMSDNKTRISTADNKRFSSYASQQKPQNIPDNAKWKDVGNRQVERELREQFAMLPEDPVIREKFADYYGVPDLYQSWMNDPLLWAKYRNDTRINRYNREASIRSFDRKYKRNIER